MALLYRRCAGLDIHRDTVVACIRTRLSRGQYEEQRETFRTFSVDLRRLVQWLKDNKVRHVAMESTGVYWIPVWNTFEASRWKFELLLVNPAQVRAMAGHKTDQIDCARIAEFLQHGRLAGSFIPPPPVREARALERRRVHLQQDRNRVVNRIGRLLQTANIKLSSVLSNIVGLSGLRILKAIADGETKGEALANLAHASLNGKKALLIAALEGCYSEHFRYLLGELLEELEHLTKKVDEVTQRLGLYMTTHAELVARMCSVPGIDRITAWTVLAEIGSDMSAFPDAARLASWAALCPGNNESAGKHKQGRTRKGNRYLRRVLVQAAWAAGRSKRTWLSALFFRFARRQGMKKAAVSVAHRMLMILYYIIRDGVTYQEKGDDHFDRLNPAKTAYRLMSRLERLGYDLSAVHPKVTGEPDPTAQLPTMRGRGRPCKCDERGVACTHVFAGLALRTRPRADTPPQPAASKTSFVPTNACLQCAQWKIPCIHVRPKIKRRKQNSTPQPSQ